MPAPISGNSSVYDPSLQSSQTDDFAGNDCTCAAPVRATYGQTAPPNVTLAATYVTGDAGAQELIRQFEQTKNSPDCSYEQRSAVLACATAAAAVLSGVASAGTIVGAVAGVAASITNGIACGAQLQALSECNGDR